LNFYTMEKFTAVPACQQTVSALARMILFCGESLLGRPSEVARSLGRERLQSSRQQKHSAEVLWS
jgi:hypothetical protein